MQYIVHGARKHDAETVAIIVEAVSPSHATTVANEQGILVEQVVPMNNFKLQSTGAASPTKMSNPLLLAACAVVLLALGATVGWGLHARTHSPSPIPNQANLSPDEVAIPPKSPSPAISIKVMDTHTMHGLGVAKSKLQGFFEKTSNFFKFKTSTDVSGYPRIAGESATGSTTIELIYDRKTDDLLAISILTDFRGIGATEAESRLLTIFSAAMLAIPDQEGDRAWIMQMVKGLQRGGANEVTSHEKHLSVSVLEGSGLTCVSIRSADWKNRPGK